MNIFNRTKAAVLVAIILPLLLRHLLSSDLLGFADVLFLTFGDDWRYEDLLRSCKDAFSDAIALSCTFLFFLDLVFII